MNATPKRPLISIVMPTFNRAHWVGDAIASLLAQQTHEAFDFELIVVDNASTDGTRDVAELSLRNAPIPTQYIYSEKPGDAPTRNAGVRSAAGEWIAFFDDDQLATPTWLYELFQAASACDGGIVGGPVHLDLSEEQLRDLGRLGRLTLREIDFYPTRQPYQGNDLPGTGNALVKRSLFDEVGLFDESMVQGGSDFNFFLSARRAGYELWYEPQAIIHHRIEANRLTSAYHRWDAMAGAAQQAMAERHARGTLFVLCSTMARIAQSLLVTCPMILWGRLSGDRGEVFSRRIQNWRMQGYLRGALHAIAPRLFPQRRFFESMEFRLGRDVGKQAAEPMDVVDSHQTAHAGAIEKEPLK